MVDPTDKFNIGVTPQSPPDYSATIDDIIFEIEDYIGGNIEGQEKIDHMGLTVFLRRTLEAAITTVRSEGYHDAVATKVSDDKLRHKFYDKHALATARQEGYKEGYRQGRSDWAKEVATQLENESNGWATEDYRKGRKAALDEVKSILMEYE